MSRAFLTLLGKAAEAARVAGLGPLFNLSRDLADRVFMKMRRPPFGVRPDGFELRGYLRHRSFLASLSGGRYELYSRQLYERSLRTGLVVVDGGAHIGLYTLLAARLVGSDGKVIAFEPDPYNFKALSFNVTRNGCRNVILLPKALSDRSSRITFYQSMGTISSSLVDRANIGPRRSIEVETAALDDELKDLATDAILIKLDLEGAEPRALRGMRRLIARTSRVVLFSEANESPLRQDGSSGEDLIAELRELGLTPHFVDEAKRALIPLTVPDVRLRKGNLYCTKG